MPAYRSLQLHHDRAEELRTSVTCLAFATLSLPEIREPSVPANGLPPHEVTARFDVLTGMIKIADEVHLRRLTPGGCEMRGS